MRNSADRMMAELLAFLDERVGKGKYLLALTADHGICPLPEVTAKTNPSAKRLPGAKIFAAAEEHLREKFDKEERANSRWIESVQPPWIYLNQTLIDSRGLKSAEAEKILAGFLVKQDGIYRAFTRGHLAY